MTLFIFTHHLLEKHMTRWDSEYDGYQEDFQGESKLLEKFQDYLNLEKNMVRNRKEEEQKSLRSLKNRNVVLALIEGTILAGLTSVFLILLGI